MKTIKYLFITVVLMITLTGCNSDGDTSTDILNSISLTDEEITSLEYMYNEEKLAKEVYLNIYEIVGGTQLYNIATKSETQHISWVKDTMDAYNVFPTEFLNLADGEYAFPELQTLYNDLYAKGTQSLQDAYEVGCLVEVTDIVDLDTAISQTKNTTLISLYESLRNASFVHYDSFDNALKGLGIIDGCCSLGTEYCF